MNNTIGNKRIVTFPALEVDDLMIYFLEGKERIKISEIEVYYINDNLTEK